MYSRSDPVLPSCLHANECAATQAKQQLSSCTALVMHGCKVRLIEYCLMQVERPIDLPQMCARECDISMLDRDRSGQLLIPSLNREVLAVSG